MPLFRHRFIEVKILTHGGMEHGQLNLTVRGFGVLWSSFGKGSESVFCVMID